MACCNKKPKQNQFLENSMKVFRAFKDANPTKLDIKILLDYHRKTHMLYAGNINRKKPNKSFINSIVDLHDRYAKEIIKRGHKHTSPLKKI